MTANSESLLRLKIPTPVLTTLYIAASIGLGFLIPYWVAVYLFGAEIRNPEQQFINMVGKGSVFTLFALGYALVFSILGLLNLAHSAVYMWGAFLGYMAVTELGVSIWLAIPLGMIGGGLVGVLVDWVAFLPLRRRNAPRTSQLISSIGAAIILVNLASIIFGTSAQVFPTESWQGNTYFERRPLEEVVIAGQTVVEDVPFIVQPIKLTKFAIAILLMVLLQYLVTSTKIGKAMRVVAFKDRIASLLGISVGMIFAFTFFLAGALGGAAGVLQGIEFNVLFNMGENIALVGLTVIVLGGLGSIRGTVVGGFLIANMQVVTTMVGYGWAEDAVVFLALFLTLLIRPRGLLGEKSQDRA